MQSLVVTKVLVVCCFILSFMLDAKPIELQPKSAFEIIKHDYISFYSGRRMLRAAGVFAGGALMAHTDIDTEFQAFHQDHIKSDLTDDAAKVVKLFGEKIIMVPLSALAATLQFPEPESKLGIWGELTLRSYLVGSPAVGASQLLTGGSRPRDEEQDAKWRPFNDDNGVSGHSFVGAVPFLTLASMQGLTQTQRNLAYFASGLSAWSRVNDDAHYLSQAMLGWYLAWESVDAVTTSDKTGQWYTIAPYVFGDGLGLSFSARW